MPHLAAEQLVERHAGALTFDVPQRDVHAAHGVEQHRTVAPVRAHIARLPDILDLVDVAADEEGLQILLERGFHDQGSLRKRRAAPPDEAGLGGLHLHHDQANAIGRRENRLDIADLDRARPFHCLRVSGCGRAEGRGHSGAQQGRSRCQRRQRSDSITAVHTCLLARRLTPANYNPEPRAADRDPPASAKATARQARVTSNEQPPPLKLRRGKLESRATSNEQRATKRDKPVPAVIRLIPHAVHLAGPPLRMARHRPAAVLHVPRRLDAGARHRGGDHDLQRHPERPPRSLPIPGCGSRRHLSDSRHGQQPAGRAHFLSRARVPRVPGTEPRLRGCDWWDQRRRPADHSRGHRTAGRR